MLWLLSIHPVCADRCYFCFAGHSCFLLATTKSQYDAMSTVSGITPDMLKYPSEHYLSGAYKVFEEHHPELVKECWEAMHVDNMLITVAAKEYEDEADQTDKWYGTKYSFATIGDDVWASWKNPNEKRTFEDKEKQAKEDAVQEFLAKLRLPDPNDMIATNFDLLPASPELFPEKDSPPRCLVENDTCELWYKPDTAFGMPKVNLIFCLHTTVGELKWRHNACLWDDLYRAPNELVSTPVC